MSRNEPSHARALLFERFEVLSVLGSGGFGRVLRVRDRESGSEVALKQLHHINPESLLRFKKEFRSLADVHHPNLVRFGELYEGEGDWAFSMELVPGVDLVSWARAGENDPGFDEARVRAGFGQLAEALEALHGHGLLHRDVKPSNVKVTPAGRVVLLDFGLVSHLVREGHTAHDASGTAAYMAPEQATAQRVFASADFYALGVMLYEALCGRLPFEGTHFQVLLNKQRRAPPPPSSHVRGIPRDLERLCMALLDRDPARRPQSGAVLAGLGRAPVEPSPFSRSGVSEGVFVGRSRELDQLFRQFEQSVQGKLRLVMLEGESGVGKSTLVRRFVRDLRQRRGDVLVLEGRCHAAEQVPFKMFDAWVDDLARFLSELTRYSCDAVLPTVAGALPVLFPVLSRVEAIHEAHARLSMHTDRVDRYTMFVAFAELLSRIAEKTPVVITIDDLQWSDEESMQLLRVMFEAQSTARALLVATVRPLDEVEGRLTLELQALRHEPHVTCLRVGQLDESDARALGAHWSGKDASDPRVEELWRDTRGHPLFIAELAVHVDDTERKAASGLDETLRRRARSLGLGPRALLELLAVASAPVPFKVLASALDVDGEELSRLSSQLRSARLASQVRRAELACYHDRIREAVLSGIEPRASAVLHQRLAVAWSKHEGVDPAQIARLFLGAASEELALPWLARAAAHCMATAAFERACDHYRTLLSLGEDRFDAAQLHETELGYADALAAAGRYAESARVLLATLGRAKESERHMLQVRAAQQLLQAGHVEEGVKAAKLALDEVDLAWPESTFGVAVRLLWGRLALSMRRRSTVLRVEADVPARAQAQLETLWRLWYPLIWADMLRSVELAGRYANKARQLGSARHVGLSACGEAVLLAMRGAKTELIDAEFARARACVDACRADDLEVYLDFTQGYASFIGWDLRSALEKLARAEWRYRTEKPGEAWMLANVRGAMLAAHYNLGEFQRLNELASTWIREADARGDRFSLATCSVLGLGNARHLMRDDPDAAAREVERAMLPWGAMPLGAQHLGEISAMSGIHMYRGGSSSYVYWKALWPKLDGTILSRTQFARELFDWLRADAALRAALVETGDARERLLREAESRVHALRRAERGITPAFAALTGAQLALLRGDPTSARAAAALAKQRASEIEHVIVHPASLLLASLDGSTAFDVEERALLGWLSQEGWAKPTRALSLHLPLYHWLVERA